MPRPAFAALALLTLILVAGCSGDDGEGKPAAAESSASLSAADSLVQTGLEQLDAGDDAEARTTFENVLELDPDNVYAHYNLGLLAQGAGRQDDAVKQYDAALATDADFAPALYNKGILLEATELDAAVGLYRRALKADPDMAAAHMRLGFALLHLGETAEAEEHLSTGIELDPSMADVEPPSYG
ncbi:tetratricopeptide repeat protein [Nocardioides carbamazepini]|uniref:tetratricopeptide repeat protein n=1 Tax=Nocardioides carbamazepini TaxID=2854259 RepID=UPI0021499D1B|nr:tetratricopeptide repeat protein [Nocardioides carbamazepini]MCR1782867.1 tetratricopeptide repeat protein [Nocardioides carbamazepini]